MAVFVFETQSMTTDKQIVHKTRNAHDWRHRDTKTTGIAPPANSAATTPHENCKVKLHRMKKLFYEDLAKDLAYTEKFNNYILENCKILARKAPDDCKEYEVHLQLHAVFLKVKDAVVNKISLGPSHKEFCPTSQLFVSSNTTSQLFVLSSTTPSPDMISTEVLNACKVKLDERRKLYYEDLTKNKSYMAEFVKYLHDNCKISAWNAPDYCKDYEVYSELHTMFLKVKDAVVNKESLSPSHKEFCPSSQLFVLATAMMPNK